MVPPLVCKGAAISLVARLEWEFSDDAQPEPPMLMSAASRTTIALRGRGNGLFRRFRSLAVTGAPAASRRTLRPVTHGNFITRLRSSSSGPGRPHHRYQTRVCI
jgi:hypothetical protein